MAEETVNLKGILSEGGEKSIAKLSFESGVKILEELVTRVESGALPLDQAILSYERGVQLVSHLRSLLSGAEEKIRVLQRPGGEK